MTFESANKPSWDDAPEWANWLAQDKDGSWHWYKTKPRADLKVWYYDSGTGKGKHKFVTNGDVIDDWHLTLEARPTTEYDPEAVAFKRELNPATSSITDNQAKQAAVETGICSDGEHYAAEPEWIKWTGETDVCPVPHGHYVEVEFLDGSRERDSTPEEWGWYNNPKHVTDGDIVAYRDWTAFSLTNQKESAEQCPESQEQGQVQKADSDLSSTEALLEQRESTYGDFATLASVVEVTQEIYSALPGWDKATPAHREAAHMILQKLARAFNGDPLYADSWRDIAGYARLAEKECTHG